LKNGGAWSRTTDRRVMSPLLGESSDLSRDDENRIGTNDPQVIGSNPILYSGGQIRTVDLRVMSYALRTFTFRSLGRLKPDINDSRSQST